MRKITIITVIVGLLASIPQLFGRNDVPSSDLEKQGYKRYRTFDEFSMSGVGTASDTPFVYVKKTPKEIIVRISNNPDSAIVYTKKGKYWKNVISEYFENINHPDLNALMIGVPPSPIEYIRYIAADTIYCMDYYFDDNLDKTQPREVFSVWTITPTCIVQTYCRLKNSFIPYKNDLKVLRGHLAKINLSEMIKKAPVKPDWSSSNDYHSYSYKIDLHNDTIFIYSKSDNKIYLKKHYSKLGLYSIAVTPNPKYFRPKRQ